MKLSLIFIQSTAERAVKTFAQAVLALLGTGSVGITTLDWRGILSVAATAALASVLTSLASLSSVVPNAAPASPSEPLTTVSAPAPTAPVIDAPATTFPAAKIDALPELAPTPAPEPAAPVEVVPVIPAAPVA